jgi:hypothetical protein
MKDIVRRILKKAVQLMEHEGPLEAPILEYCDAIDLEEEVERLREQLARLQGRPEIPPHIIETARQVLEGVETTLRLVAAIDETVEGER